uniref:(northern house mosquito) hypothetical protein n=1 Tax=Culex pipiens TaxID=7175 RepID=A0A8D8KJK2_CULPI
MYRRAGVRAHRRTVRVRVRFPLPARHLQGQDVPPGPGQQLVHLPGCGARSDLRRGGHHPRGDVPHFGPTVGRDRHRRGPGTGQPLPAARAHPGLLDQDCRPRHGVRVRERTGLHQAGTKRQGSVYPRANVRPGLQVGPARHLPVAQAVKRDENPSSNVYFLFISYVLRICLAR